MKSFPQFLTVVMAAALSTLTAPRAAAATSDTNTAPPETSKHPRIEDFLPDPVIAKGTGFEIKQSQLDELVDSLKARARATGQEITPDRLPMLERELLDHLIQVRILNCKATDEQKAKAKELADQNLEKYKKLAPTEEAWIQQVKAMGLTPERVRARLTEEAIAQVAIRARVKVTDEDLKKYYDENPSQFERAETARVCHILLYTQDPNTGEEFSDEKKREKRKKIESLLKRARDGEDFTKLALDNSEATSVKEKGCEIEIPKSTFNTPPVVPAEFEAAAFSLKTNQISDVVVSRVGYHIIKLLEKTPPRRVELANVSDDLKQVLENKEVEKILPTYYTQIKKENNVEILDEKLKALEAAADAAPRTERPDKSADGK
ncbi:MAG TPA: peptidylprolyl isomerase [Verrucomicrobiae bacterium]|nr:peptidylprolyl isomerase [Verrucomicrobiae bacterium]